MTSANDSDNFMKLFYLWRNQGGVSDLEIKLDHQLQGCSLQTKQGN